MLDNKGFDLWADGYDKTVGVSDEENTYPFAGYKDVLGTIYKTIMEKENAVVLDIGFGTGAPRSHQDGLFSCRQGQLLLGRKVPCDGMGQPLGDGAKGHSRRQFQHRNLPPIRSGL